jgi:hypothetical protein
VPSGSRPQSNPVSGSAPLFGDVTSNGLNGLLMPFDPMCERSPQRRWVLPHKRQIALSTQTTMQERLTGQSGLQCLWTDGVHPDHACCATAAEVLPAVTGADCVKFGGVTRKE